MSEEFSKESVAKSEKVIGQLYPRLVNQEGKSLDGDHRLAANPKWETKVVETKNRSEEILVRMHAHHRRRVPQEETKAMMLELTKELEQSGIPKQDIAAELVKIVPYSKRWVLMLLPREFKKVKKVEAGIVAGELIHKKMKELPQLSEDDKKWLAATVDTDGHISISDGQPRIGIFNTNRDLVEKAARLINGTVRQMKSRSKKTLYRTGRHGMWVVLPILKQIEPYLIVKKDIATEIISLTVQKPLVECARCHLAHRDTVEYKGEMLCPPCLEKAKYKPEKARAPPPAPSPDLTGKITTTILKPKLSWKDRKARMQAPVSKMDEAIYLRLQANEKLREEGWKIVFQKRYCITEIISDVTLKKGDREIACFFDNEYIHRNRQERDELNRQKAADRHGITVLPLPYKSFNKTEEDQILNRIVEATK